MSSDHGPAPQVSQGADVAKNGGVLESIIEPLLERFGDMLTAERAADWAAGDIVVEALAAAPDIPAARIYRRFASIGHCTAEHIRQLAERCVAFPTEHRSGHIAPSLYRACVQVARRTKESAPAILERALKENWHVDDVHQLASRDAKVYRLRRGKCGGCGAVWTGRSREATGALPCPRCVVRLWEDGLDGKDADKIGRLE